MKISSPLQILVLCICSFNIFVSTDATKKTKVNMDLLYFSDHTMNTESYLDKCGFVGHFYNNNIITDKPTWC